MSEPPHILVVEDDRDISRLVGRYLRENDCRVSFAADGREMDECLASSRIDLVVLDVMLPGEDGLSLCRRLRATSHLPVVMLTAKGDEVDRIIGLEMGADDYLAKPFNPHELTARVAAILRRTAARSGDEVPAHLSLGGGRLVVDSESRQFTLAPSSPGQAPSRGSLTPGEAGLLAALARRPGSVLAREQLLPAVTRRPDDVYDRVVDVHVANLRRKLGDDPANPWLIETIPQSGYRLIATRDPA